MGLGTAGLFAVPGFYGEFCKITLDPVQFLLGAILQVDEAILSRSDSADNFIQLDLQRQAVAVLAVLNNEDHEKCANGCSGIDHHLPAWGKSEIGTAYGPAQYEER